MWHPWQRLRHLPEVVVHWTTTLPSGVLGASHGHRIWLDPRQLQSERRSTLTHELEHLERGHAGCVSPREEKQVRHAAARRLVTMDRLLDVASWTNSFEEAADELWVDVDTLYARLDALTPDERDQLVTQYEALEGGA